MRALLRQAGRHERAIEACLSELTGTCEPNLGLITFVLGRGRLHADRASGLTATASHLNRDAEAVTWLAATVVRQERNAVRLERWSAGPAASDLAS